MCWVPYAPPGHSDTRTAHRKSLKPFATHTSGTSATPQAGEREAAASCPDQHVQVQLGLSETTAHALWPPVCPKRTGRGCAIRLDRPRRLSARPCRPRRSCSLCVPSGSRNQGFDRPSATTSDSLPSRVSAFLGPSFCLRRSTRWHPLARIGRAISSSLSFPAQLRFTRRSPRKRRCRSGRSAAALATDCDISSSNSVTGGVVDPHDKGRGYEVADKRFLMVEDEELYAARAAQSIAPTGSAEPSATRLSSARPGKADARHPVDEDEGEELEELARPLPVAQRPENTHTIEIEHFVPRVQLDPAFSKSRTL